LVSKIIKDTPEMMEVTNKSPNLRYLAGKDVETWAASKKIMSYAEFQNMMQNLTR
jgi:hypothetical protein